MATVDEILELTKHLDREQIGVLTVELMKRLDEVSDDPGVVKKEWDETISRRVQEIKDGTARTVPGDEVFRKVREKFGLDV